jgi:predicted dehydrogenase
VRRLSLIATAAARAGKDMYCKKPTGVCINDGFAMRTAIRKNKRVFQSGMWQRSLGNFRQGCELALNGHLGKITTSTRDSATTSRRGKRSSLMKAA